MSCLLFFSQGESLLSTAFYNRKIKTYSVYVILYHFARVYIYFLGFMISLLLVAFTVSETWGHDEMRGYLVFS